jgi:ammonium transporter, Amt family
MGPQLAAACTCALWSFVISCILLFIINKIPGLHLRVSEEDELRGLDFKYFSDVDLEGWEQAIDRSGRLAMYGGVTPKVEGSPVQSSSREDVATGPVKAD